MPRLPKTAIARHLNADPSLVARWVRRGMPLYSLEAAAAWHSANIRPRRKRKAIVGPAAPVAEPVAGDPPCRSWYDKRQRVLTLHAERELALLERRSLDAAAVQATWVKLISTVRAAVLAIPNRAAAQVPAQLRAKIEALLTTLCDEALREIAYPKGNGRDTTED